MIRLFLLFTFAFCFTAEAKSTAHYISKWDKAWREAQSGATNLDPRFSWQEDSSSVIFKHESLHKDGSKSWNFLSCSVTTGDRQPAFDHEDLAKQLNRVSGKEFDASRLPLENIRLTKERLSFRVERDWYQKKDGTLEKIARENRKSNKPERKKKAKPNSQISPDGKWRAFVKDRAVFLVDLQPGSDNTPREIGKPNTDTDYYHGAPVWNASSSHFIMHYMIPGQRRTVTLVESSPKDQLQPKLHTFRYDKPGDKIDRQEPHIFSIGGKPRHMPDPELTKDAFSIGHASWDTDGERVIYEYVERGFGKHYLIAMDAASGKHSLLAKEESDTFIFVSGVRYRKNLTDTREIIWGSDRDGWRHLYLLGSDTGKVKHRITEGNWIVRKVEHVDEQNRSIIFQASGRNQGEDPYHIHWYRVKFDGSQLTQLTEADGNHKLLFSPDGKYYIDTWSRVDQPPVSELRRSADSKLISTLTKSDISGLLAQGRALPERFVCKDRNGRFDIWGMILTPPNFDPNKKYPILEYIYAGPHGAFVPKNFSAWHGYRAEMTEEGFVVVMIDALGTNYRHHDFSHFSYKNLVDSGFPDRIKWIQEAAKTRPYMDVSRVGIYGGSAGGQSATSAVLHHGQFYKAAASDCGCHDNRMDKIWWNEQWMDWPVGPHYKEQSNITHAGKLQGALMLTVGELDKNVDPSSTTQLVDALTRADKDFEYYISTSSGHGSGEKPVMRRKRLEFFQKHLGSVQ
ncbi:prolyl oligopeptidase family serine peptidase [Oceaniferula spumae]